ncbi:9691_t:CDS:2, partial [Funneliformis caledonium]
NEKTSEEVKDFWEDKKFDQKLNTLDKKRGIVNFLQTGNERLNDTSKIVHKSQLNFLERNEAKKSRIDEQEKEAEDANKNESVADNKPYDLREKRNINYNEEHLSKKQCGYTIPSPGCQSLHPLPMDNSFSEKENEDEDENEDGVIIINDIDELCFKDGDPENDLKIGDNNVSQLFRKYQNESAKIAKTEGLFAESNVHEILSLSSIFLLAPELSSEYETKFRKVVKQATKESRHKAIKLLVTELSNDETLGENLGFVILKGLEMLLSGKVRNEPSEITFITNYLDYIMKGTFHDADKHIVQWPNTALNEREVSPPLQKTNVYKNCCDLIRLGVFMKDCMDFAIEKGADIKIGFQCVGHIIDFYMIDLVEGIYVMVHIGQVSVPASLKEMLSFVDQIEILLGIREIFKRSFDILYDNLCNPNLSSVKKTFKRDTLNTPQFNNLLV